MCVLEKELKMTIELPRLVILDLYRNALTTVEKLSRANRDRKLHAWAVKAKKETGDLIMQCANDEMDDVGEEEDEEKQKKADEEFYGI